MWAYDILARLTVFRDQLPAQQLADNRALMSQMQIVHRLADILLPVFMEGEEDAAQTGRSHWSFLHCSQVFCDQCLRH